MENVFPLPEAAWSAELMWSNSNAKDNPNYMPLVWVLRHREGKLEEQRVYSHIGEASLSEKTARLIAAKRLAPTVQVETEEIRPPTTGEVRPLWGLVPKAVESYRDDMVDTIIAEQVTRGGVDTEGTRAQAERWCAMLAGCVCDGMRATTEQSAYRLRPWERTRANRDVPFVPKGKPLGRP